VSESRQKLTKDIVNDWYGELAEAYERRVRRPNLPSNVKYVHACYTHDPKARCSTAHEDGTRHSAHAIRNKVDRRASRCTRLRELPLSTTVQLRRCAILFKTTFIP